MLRTAGSETLARYLVAMSNAALEKVPDSHGGKLPTATETPCPIRSTSTLDIRKDFLHLALEGATVQQRRERVVRHDGPREPESSIPVAVHHVPRGHRRTTAGRGDAIFLELFQSEFSVVKFLRFWLEWEQKVRHQNCDTRRKR